MEPTPSPTESASYDTGPSALEQERAAQARTRPVTGKEDPAWTGDVDDSDTPVRPGGGGAMYADGDDTLPREHERDVKAR
jgi:hypothetical protein